MCPPSDPVGGALAMMITPAPLAPIRPPSTAPDGAGDAQVDVKGVEMGHIAAGQRAPAGTPSPLRSPRSAGQVQAPPDHAPRDQVRPSRPVKINDDILSSGRSGRRARPPRRGTIEIKATPGMAVSLGGDELCFTSRSKEGDGRHDDAGEGTGPRDARATPTSLCSVDKLCCAEGPGQ